MDAKISLFFMCVEAIIYLLLYYFHDCTFTSQHGESYKNRNKNSPLVAKKHKQISINLNLTQPHQKTMEVFTSYNHFKTFTSHTGF